MNKNIDLGIFISRIAIGLPMLVYGISKLIHGVCFIEDLVIAKGFPSFFAYGVFVGEIIAPVMIIAGKGIIKMCFCLQPVSSNALLKCIRKQGSYRLRQRN
ncbi:DoxX family protein [Elizabethkingia meningoseptica]|uniref:DoxX family protein n=1 Tax=Elizabethkingia meningoseptica TaxID=238 RepID=UPI0021A4620F|nr:DoxX family protein [Elizabethkingia meningoseptica]